jgi:aldehyde:ferredoxin oxidoreductase
MNNSPEGIRMNGNTGKVINVDLGTGRIETETLPGEYYTGYIGGSGLAAKIFWERGDFSAAPLSPEAMLIFMNGPFAGIKLSGASRNSVAGRSPLTGSWGDSSCGGYFAPELRYAGYDGIIIKGKAEKPSMLLIEDEKIQLLPALEYWGNGTEAVNSAIKNKYGKNYRTLVIGPAGENLVKYSIILNEGHHAFGRAGFGAVMGSKNLKAIAVKASAKKMNLADPEKFEELRAELNPKIKDALASDVMRENLRAE